MSTEEKIRLIESLSPLIKGMHECGSKKALLSAVVELTKELVPMVEVNLRGYPAVDGKASV